MPVKLIIKINKARDMPVMDSRSNSTDAYVEVKVAEQAVRSTKIVRKSLNPLWDKTFEYELPFDKKIQDLPIEIRVMDKDTLSRDDVIGSVLIDLSPPLMSYSSGIQGWFPIFDTMRGIRGELRVSVSLEFLGDVNPYRNSSAGVQFFNVSNPPDAEILSCCGLVSELVVKPDPEYRIVDSFRASRVSNTERQQTFSALAGKLRRRLGIRAQEMDYNAILCYRQHFDVETSLGYIVGRGYGPLCRIGAPSAPQTGCSILPDISSFSQLQGVQFLTLDRIPQDYIGQLCGTVIARSVELLKSGPLKKIEKKRERWFDELRSQIRGHARALGCSLVLGYREEVSIDGDLYLLSASGTAVSLLQHVSHAAAALSSSESEPGYPSNSSTASSNHSLPSALNKSVTPPDPPSTLLAPDSEDDASTEYDIDNSDDDFQYSDVDLEFESSDYDVQPSPRGAPVTPGGGGDSVPQLPVLDPSIKSASKMQLRKSATQFSPREDMLSPCSFCHIPSSGFSSPHLCGICHGARVPPVLLTTIEPPISLAVVGSPHLLQVRVCRKKKKLGGEQNAFHVSRIMPFIEFDLHRQITYKLRLMCMNAVCR